MSVSGTNISIKGAPGSALDGSGELWWDQDGKQKPKFFRAHSLSNSTIEGIRIVNAPVHVFSINGCTNLTLANVTINNTLGDRLGKNTDGFDISASSNIKILGAVVYNQDDCVAINSGTDIVFRGGLCVGGHGLSVGSIGGRSNNAVKNVLFENSTMKNSQNGVRIKTKYGENGTVDAVTYRHIQLSNITKYGIPLLGPGALPCPRPSCLCNLLACGTYLSELLGGAVFDGGCLNSNCADILAAVNRMGNGLKAAPPPPPPGVAAGLCTVLVYRTMRLDRVRVAWKARLSLPLIRNTGTKCFA